ncbi:MAG: DNA polymerase III subunit beta [Polyangiaceae bacterium]
MKLVVPKKNLLRLLQRCQGVADKKSTMPVLANVLISARDNLVEVAATDLYISVRGSTEAEVEREGAVAIPARDVFNRVKHMPEGPIEIDVTDGSTTIIKSGSSARRYTLHGLPGADFPKLPIPNDEGIKLDLPINTLQQLIARTHFSISHDETRAHLNSALFECGDGVVRMVTTDGHRLSKMEIPVEKLSGSTTMLVPLKAVMELRKLTDEVTENRETTVIRVSQAGPNAFFDLCGVQFSVKLIDAQFPPYEAVIPATTDRAVRTSRSALADALKAVSLAANERTGGVKLSVVDNSLRISSESPESGNGYDQVPVDYDGPEISVGFNAHYLLDVLQSIDDDDVTLGLSGELDPAVVRPASEHDDYIAVVMPMRI